MLWKSHQHGLVLEGQLLQKAKQQAQSKGHRLVSNAAPKTWAAEGNEGLLNETRQLGGLHAPEEVEITFWRSKVGQNSRKLATAPMQALGTFCKFFHSLKLGYSYF